MHRSAHQKETMINHPIPTLLWKVVASDMVNFDGREYVVVVDYYSNYPEVERLPDTRSATVMYKIKGILVRHGKCDIKPRLSNSLTERTVQTIKRLMKKAKEEEKDLYLILLELRNTPVHGLASPA